MFRTSCVICSNTEFIDIYKYENYPIVFTPPANNKTIEDDEVADLNFMGCRFCGCVQTKILIDPRKLYEDAYNITYNYPTMQRHHHQFAEFVINNIVNTKIIEIGGSNGALAKIILGKKAIEYTVMDLCDRDPNLPNIGFINANCETSDFPANHTIILSHVFEHLYNPLTFVANLKKNNVNQILIANPDFTGLLDRNDTHFINFEHTYFCHTPYLDYIMNQHGYVRKNIQNHESWATFYNYIKSDTSVEISSTIREETYLLDKLKEYFIQRENKIKAITINNENKTFICTAGHYGQLVYTLINEQVKKNVIGFLDSDPFKIGKRVYGAEHFTFEKSKLQEYENINVILCAERYRDEITAEILSHNKNANIINV